jgi:hypothetical protein
MNIEIAPKEYEIRANWDNARLYCFALCIDGKTGWRLPTVKELDQFYLLPNGDFARGFYWSSQEVDDTHAIDVDFRRSAIIEFGSTENKDYADNLVRPVRDLKDD